MKEQERTKQNKREQQKIEQNKSKQNKTISKEFDIRYTKLRAVSHKIFALTGSSE